MENENGDRLSDLPSDLIEQILCSMPIKSAAKTSLLSTQWRNKWKSISRLSITVSRQPFFSVHWLRSWQVNRVILDLLSGPIRSCRITEEPWCGPKDRWCGPKDLDFYYVDWWVNKLAKHPLEELEIVPSCNFDSWTVPDNAFLSWKRLTRLRIRDCHLAPPASFRGFASLRSLHLECVTAPRGSLQRLISGSPALEALFLSLERGADDDGFDIDNAPSLKSVEISMFVGRDSVGVRFINCPALKECDLTFYGGLVRGYNVAELLAGSPGLQILRISCVSIQCLASRVVPRELPYRLEDLRVLSIETTFGSHKHITAVYLLLSSVRNLQELNIQWRSSNNRTDMSDNQEEQKAERWDLEFPCLKKIRVSYFKWLPEEFNFLELMLLASPVLEEVRLIDDRRPFDPPTMTRFLSLKPRSLTATLSLV